MFGLLVFVHLQFVSLLSEQLDGSAWLTVCFRPVVSLWLQPNILRFSRLFNLLPQLHESFAKPEVDRSGNGRHQQGVLIAARVDHDHKLTSVDGRR